jgi:two-component system LytT family response regulator
VKRVRVYLVDDEPLALSRLSRLLERDARVTIAGTTTDPTEALAFLDDASNAIDVVFLDVQMPTMTGLELARRLCRKPWIVFVTAHDRYALGAFETNAIDYLLKPVRAADLDRALSKIERASSPADVEAMLARMHAMLSDRPLGGADRIASRLGDRIVLLDLDRITHFSSEDKLVHAFCEGRGHVVDPTIAELSSRLEARGFFRIHRGTIVNLAFVVELFAKGEGGAHVRLRDATRTELAVSRDRVRALKSRLGV